VFQASQHGAFRLLLGVHGVGPGDLLVVGFEDELDHHLRRDLGMLEAGQAVAAHMVLDRSFKVVAARAPGSSRRGRSVRP
jgi:hypothetical protein